MGKTTGCAPHSLSIAEKIEELNSIISPGLGSAHGGTISSPVGIIATRGLLKTSTLRTPPAISAPTAAGVIFVYDGSIISPAHISSPICRTFFHGAAGAWIVTLPSGSCTSSSTIITASQPSGRGSPVSTTVKLSMPSVTGVVSVAPKLSLAARAIPSIAQAA